jgi:Rod binding domain-containing protein
MTGPIALPGAPLPLSTTPTPPHDDVPPEVRRAAEEFEAVFLNQMLAPMFEGIQTDGLGGGGMGEEIFRPMLIERYAQSLTQAGGIGIADSIIRELMRMQEMSAPPQEDADGAAG